MADVASLVVRVNADGAETAAKQLDTLSSSAAAAEGSTSSLVKSTEKAAAPTVAFTLATETLGNKIAILEEAQEKGARSAAILAAQLRLGADASRQEIDAVGKLAGKLYDLSNSAKVATKGGFGGLRTAAQQTGFQLQDMIVQIQGGTSAFVAFGQQGSQLAGAFGPGGAVLGAVIALASAIGGTLYKSMGDASASAKDLESATKEVEEVIQLTSKGVYEASDAFVTYVESGATAYQINAQIAQGLSSLNVLLGDYTKKIIEAATETRNFSLSTSLAAASMARGGNAVGAINFQLDASAEKLGITRAEFDKLTAAQKAFADTKTPEAARALAQVTGQLNEKYKGANKNLAAYNTTIQENSYSIDQNVKAKEKAANADKEAAAAIAERNKKEADREAAAAKRESDRAAREAKNLANREAREAASAEKQAQRQRDQAQNFLNTVARQNSDELAAIDAQEQQKLAKLQEFRANETISLQEFEAAKTQITSDAQVARDALLNKQAEEQKQKQFSADSFIEQIQAQNEGELAEIDRQQEAKLAKLQNFYDLGLVAEDKYQAARTAIQENADKQRLDSYTGTLGDVTSALKTSLGENNALYKAAAITQTIIETYKGATAAYASLATIPVVGPALGIAAAAAITAAGLANVGKIRSAREQGGNLAAGQASTIAERKAEVIVPASASRVRTAQQMRQIMGENPSNSSSDSVVIVNQTTGRIDNAQTERDDEGRLRVIIREIVSGDMQDSNSDISKSRKASRGQPGF